MERVGEGQGKMERYVQQAKAHGGPYRQWKKKNVLLHYVYHMIYYAACNSYDAVQP